MINVFIKKNDKVLSHYTFGSFNNLGKFIEEFYILYGVDYELIINLDNYSNVNDYKE